MKSKLLILIATIAVFVSSPVFAGKIEDLEREVFVDKIMGLGETSAIMKLAEIYHYGLEGQQFNFEKAEWLYLDAAKEGDDSAYINIARMYHYGPAQRPADHPDWLIRDHKVFLEAHSFEMSGYLKRAENGDTSVYRPLAEMFLRLAPAGSFELSHLACGTKAGQYYLKIAESCHYTDLSKAVHWYTKTLRLLEHRNFWLTMNRDGQYAFRAKCRLRSLVVPNELWKIFQEPIPKSEETEVKLSNALAYLQHLAGKFSQKHEDCVGEDSVKTNPRKSFSDTFKKASALFPKVFEEGSFVFMTPKAALLNQLTPSLKVYDPQNPTSSDEVGLRLYHLNKGTVLTFGNEDVKLCDEVMDILEGKYSLRSLIAHYQEKNAPLEKLLSLKKEGKRITKKTLKNLERSIINNLGSGLSSEELDQALLSELTTRIEKRSGKIKILEDVVANFEKDIRASQPRKIGRFNQEFPYLAHMFE